MSLMPVSLTHFSQSHFPQLINSSGDTDIRDVPINTNASSFLDRERALLGEDADQFATPQDSRLATVEDAEDDLLGGSGNFDSGDHAEMQEFESAFPDIDTTNAV